MDRYNILLLCSTGLPHAIRSSSQLLLGHDHGVLLGVVLCRRRRPELRDLTVLVHWDYRYWHCLIVLNQYHNPIDVMDSSIRLTD